jgi:hypothetical protein
MENKEGIDSLTKKIEKRSIGIENIKKVCICIPTYVSIKAELFQQFIELIQWASRRPLTTITTIPNRTHNDARNWLATAGGGNANPNNLTEQVDIIVWIDSDMVFTLEDITKLLSYEDDPFVAGWYVKTNNQNMPTSNIMAARWDEDKFLKDGHMDFLQVDEVTNSKEELIECDYTGFGFVKMNTSVLKKMTYPYFTNKIVNIGGLIENCSEDVSFCLDSPVKPKIVRDLRVGHFKSTVI